MRSLTLTAQHGPALHSLALHSPALLPSLALRRLATCSQSLQSPFLRTFNFDLPS